MVSFAAQVYSIQLLDKKKNYSYRLNQEIGKRIETVVATNVWWIPQFLSTEFYNKSIFYVKSVEQLKELMQKLRIRGHESMPYVTMIPGEALPPNVTKIDDEGLNFFSVSVY